MHIGVECGAGEAKIYCIIGKSTNGSGYLSAYASAAMRVTPPASIIYSIDGVRK